VAPEQPACQYVVYYAYPLNPLHGRKLEIMADLQELLRQQQALNAQIEEARRKEVASAVAKVRELVQQYALNVSDVFPGGGNGGRRRSRVLGKVAPKYRDPSSGKTWTGRGKAPKWIEGKDRNQFAI
jgi:DNA-binding protein H-NS